MSASSGVREKPVSLTSFWENYAIFWNNTDFSRTKKAKSLTKIYRTPRIREHCQRMPPFLSRRPVPQTELEVRDWYMRLFCRSASAIDEYENLPEDWLKANFDETKWIPCTLRHSSVARWAMYTESKKGMFYESITALLNAWFQRIISRPVEHRFL